MNDFEPLAPFNVSRETTERLKLFVDLVKKWNPAINLVSRATMGDIWSRHIADSVQVFRAAPAAENWVDLGSGGGFPGLVAALVAMDELPGLRVALIESDGRKCAFLRTVIRETGAKATVVAQRAETAPVQNGDVVSARAVAKLGDLLGYARRHLGQGGIGLFPKGVTWQKELKEARRQWRFDAESITSVTGAGAVVLRIRNIERV